MKLIKVGNQLINLDKVIFVETETNVIHLEGDKEILIRNDEEFNQFVTFYNLYDTDETKELVMNMAKLILANPDYLTDKEIKNRIIKFVKYHDLKDYLNEINEGKKLKEMTPIQRINILKKLQQKVFDMAEDNPF